MNQIEKYFNELKTLQMVETESGNFLTTKTYECKLNNGEIIKREKILKNGGSGSASIILPITEDNKVILAVEPRVFTKRTVDVGLPAGYIEKNETALDAAKRELLEETGYTTDEFVSLGSFYQDQACSEAYNHYFVALHCKKVKEQKLDKGEFIKYILVDFEEIDCLIEKGYIGGLNSIYALEKGKNYLKKK